MYSAIRPFIKDLILDIPECRMELDRAHRPLRPPRTDGLPRDIIVKSHFYAVKEKVIKLSRALEKLVFPDLSPYTVQKQQSLKPLLQVLAQFFLPTDGPFHLNFSHHNKGYGISSFPEGEYLLLHLGLITQVINLQSISRGSSTSTKRPSPPSPLTPVWQKHTSKRSKESQPP